MAIRDLVNHEKDRKIISWSPLLVYEEGIKDGISYQRAVLFDQGLPSLFTRRGLRSEVSFRWNDVIRQGSPLPVYEEGNKGWSFLRVEFYASS